MYRAMNHSFFNVKRRSIQREADARRRPARVELSIDTITGISALPIGMMTGTPNMNALSFRMMNDSHDCVGKKITPKPSFRERKREQQVGSGAALHRPPVRAGRAGTCTCSNAITEPENVIAPTNVPINGLGRRVDAGFVRVCRLAPRCASLNPCEIMVLQTNARLRLQCGCYCEGIASTAGDDLPDSTIRSIRTDRLRKSWRPSMILLWRKAWCREPDRWLMPLISASGATNDDRSTD